MAKILATWVFTVASLRKTARTDPEIEALLRTLPGTAHVTAAFGLPLSLVGYPQTANVSFLRGDSATLGYEQAIVTGRWLERPGEIAATSALLQEYGLAVGDRATMAFGDQQTTVTVVGELLSGGPGPVGIYSDWQTLTRLASDYPVEPHQVMYRIQLAPGADVGDYLAAVAAADPGLRVWDNRGTNDFTVTVISLSTLITVMLSTVAALGVFNTVVLNVREHRRDLGVLKSIGMTSRQVMVMLVASVTALGVTGGVLAIPIGTVAHRLIVPAAADAALVRLPEFLLTVWQPATLALLALAGVAIAVLGALVPARAAARLTIAEVLHNE